MTRRGDEAAALVPDDPADALHIVGDAARVRDRVQEWDEAGVTTLLLSCRSREEIRRVAEAVLG